MIRKQRKELTQFRQEEAQHNNAAADRDDASTQGPLEEVLIDLWIGI